MKKKISLICLFIALGLSSAQAQNEVTVHDSETGKDEIIGLPEGMVSDIDSLLEEWNVRNYLSYDESCESSEENPTFPRETYINRLERLPNVIEMPYNEVVQKFIDQYSGRLRRSVSFMLGACNFYNPIFEEALESYQLPLELKYLPVIESALNPKATSRVGAAGLWQFMVTTGKSYGLDVTSLVDERRDPIKSSYAAAHYLKDLYAIYKDWTLVIAAYNCGPGNVNKAINRAGGSKDYWVIYPYLPQETRGYVPAFIAANYIMNYYCEHNICPVNTKLPGSTDTLMINRNVHFEQISAMCNVSMDEIKALNPQYRTGLIPGDAGSCTLRLPTAGISAFINAKDSVYNYKSDELFTRRSETNINTAVSKNTKRGSRSANKKGQRTVTVRKGDTLSAIATRNGVSVKQLQRLNGIRGTNIRAGQRIRVK
ncbi:MAG: transglycosylase SLT domain-containing protein [Clostridium sp.]|nr:transglycosylase SLT domain-containing protein [Clostridium sp.]